MRWTRHQDEAKFLPSAKLDKPSMKQPVISIALAFVLVPFFLSSPLRGDESFADATRFATVGDSITHSGRYGFYLQLFYLTRFPRRDVEILNLGIAGDSASGGMQRVKWDILTNKVNAVSLMFGMNDVNRDLYKPDVHSSSIDEQRLLRIDNYSKSLRSLVGILKANGVRVVLITPTIYDETSTQESPNLPGVNSIGLEECTKRVFEIAAEENLQVVDFFHPMLELNRKEQAKDPAFSIVGKDRVHPGPAGHLLMALLFLRAQNISPFVAKMCLDAAHCRTQQAENCTVEELQADSTHLTFRYRANALPFPIESLSKAALEWDSVIGTIDQEILQITGLVPGRYLLAIDGQVIRDWSAEDLSNGVNLAMEEATPQYQQALHVMNLLQERWWQQIVVLRDIVLAEYRAMGASFPRPLTLEQVQPKLEERLKSSLGTPSEEACRRSLEKYLSDKPREDNLRLQVAAGLSVIRLAAQPRVHLIKLTRVVEPASTK